MFEDIIKKGKSEEDKFNDAVDDIPVMKATAKGFSVRCPRCNGMYISLKDVSDIITNQKTNQKWSIGLFECQNCLHLFYMKREANGHCK